MTSGICAAAPSSSQRGARCWSTCPNPSCSPTATGSCWRTDGRSRSPRHPRSFTTSAPRTACISPSSPGTSATGISRRRSRTDRILILRDHVIKAMLEGLGAKVTEVVEPFSPVRGAYSGHGHDHHHEHDHATTITITATANATPTAACLAIRTTATTMPESQPGAAQLRLMAFLSPAFPIGGFSYSHGLERAAHDGFGCRPRRPAGMARRSHRLRLRLERRRAFRRGTPARGKRRPARSCRARRGARRLRRTPSRNDAAGRGVRQPRHVPGRIRC